MIEHCLDKKNGTLYLKFSGDITSTCHDQVSGEIEKILSDPLIDNMGWQSMELDLLSARIIDSMGLNVIVDLIRRVKARNGTIKSKISSRTIYRTYLFTRLEKQMEIEFVEPTSR